MQRDESSRVKAVTTVALPEVTISEHEGVRYLHLGTSWVQGAMRLVDPQRVELEYVQRMLAALLWLPTPWLDDRQRRAVQLGLGAATLTRFAHQCLRWDTVAVELNPQVLAACRTWFRLPASGPGLACVLADAGAWVAQQAEPGSVHLLQVDLYDAQAAAPVIDDAAFYAACRACLAEGGVMAVNLFGRDASFARSIGRIACAFGSDQVWQLRATREGNTVVIAGRGLSVPAREVLLQRAFDIEGASPAMACPHASGCAW